LANRFIEADSYSLEALAKLGFTQSPNHKATMIPATAELLKALIPAEQLRLPPSFGIGMEMSLKDSLNRLKLRMPVKNYDLHIC